MYFHSLCFPHMVFTKNIIEIITHKSGNAQIIGFLIPTLPNETILWSLFTIQNQKCQNRIFKSPYSIFITLYAIYTGMSLYNCSLCTDYCSKQIVIQQFGKLNTCVNLILYKNINCYACSIKYENLVCLLCLFSAIVLHKLLRFCLFTHYFQLL